MKNEPIFPYKEKIESPGLTTSCPSGTEIIEHPGMSKRFYAACAAMQGFLSNYHVVSTKKDLEEYDVIIKESYKIADELLKQEECDPDVITTTDHTINHSHSTTTSSSTTNNN